MSRTRGGSGGGRFTATPAYLLPSKRRTNELNPNPLAKMSLMDYSIHCVTLVSLILNKSQIYAF